MLTDEHDNGAPARSPRSLDGLVTAIMATYWSDVDAVWQRAVAAGAEVIYPLADQFYGDRAGRLRDPFGQQWMLSQRLEQLSADEHPSEPRHSSTDPCNPTAVTDQDGCTPDTTGHRDQPA